MTQHRRNQIVETLFLAAIGIALYMFLPAITDWVSHFSPPHHASLQESMQKYGISGVAQDDPVPFSTRAAGWIWRVVGTMMAGAVLMVVYFRTARIGWINPSGTHGIAGIITGFAILIFMTAFLYSEGYPFSFSLITGAIVSVGLKLFFSYWRTRLHGDPEPRQPHVIYRHEHHQQQLNRRE